MHEGQRLKELWLNSAPPFSIRTRTSLAELLNITPQMVSHIWLKQETISPEHLEKACEVMGCTPEQFADENFNFSHFA